MNTPLSQRAQAEGQAGEDLAEARSGPGPVLGLSGRQAAKTPLPSETPDVFAPAPDIQAGPYSVRRFVDRDFMLMGALRHPLNRFTALADGSYDFEPTGPLAWQLCWLMTRPAKDAKAALREGVEAAKDEAEDIFGELGILAISQIMAAIAKQMTVYSRTPNQAKAEPDD